MANEYTPEQIADADERQSKGMQLLKDLQLTPAALVEKIHIGHNVFSDKVTAFLQDTKYSKVETPEDSLPTPYEPSKEA